MVTSSDVVIDERIVEMRKKRFGLFRIHKWLVQWDNFSQLDKMVVLAHILNVCDKNNLAITRNEVKYTFNKFYNFKYHGNKRGYLNWLYREFHIKIGSVVSVERSHKFVTSKGNASKQVISEEMDASKGLIPNQLNEVRE